MKVFLLMIIIIVIEFVCGVCACMQRIVMVTEKCVSDLGIV